MQISMFVRLNCLNAYAHLAFKRSLNPPSDVPIINPQNEKFFYLFEGDFFFYGLEVDRSYFHQKLI